MTEKNSSLATQKSALAFQIADGAAENVLKRIYKDTDPTLSSLATALTPVLDSDGREVQAPTYYIPQCVNGTISVTRLPELDAGSYSVSFFDANSQPLQCSGAGYNTNTEWRTKVARIVSSGTYNGVTRAIDTTIRPAPCGGTTTVNDADGNPYDTIEIGNQCWMVRNMRVGTTINSSTAQTNNSTIEKYCYGDIPGNCTSNHPNQPDGGLYSWNEAMQYSTTEGAQGICPSGWHIPTDDEWYTLENFVDPTTVTPTELGYPGSGADIGLHGTDAGTKLKFNGTSGFEINMTGDYRGYASSFQYRDLNNGATMLHTSSLADPTHFWLRNAAAQAPQMSRGSSGSGNLNNLFVSVRCIKD